VLGPFAPCKDWNMSQTEQNSQFVDEYLATAELVRPKYRGLLLDIIERYYEIEGGYLPPQIGEAIRHLRDKQSPIIH
jgi:hypothetical protein